MKRGLLIVMVLFLALSGCTSVDKGAGKQDTPPKDQQIDQAFYGFPDIPVPKELSYDYGRSFVYETPLLKAGVLVFNGNVEVKSLENYFKINMARNGWRFVNSFQYTDVILNFEKEGKVSNIRISRGAFNTNVEITVGPSGKDEPPKPVSGRGDSKKGTTIR